MTLIMTGVGVLMFVISLFTASFKVAMKRLWLLALTGVLIDMILISSTIAIAYFVSTR